MPKSTRPPPAPRAANLTDEQKRLAIPRLTSLVTDLESLEVDAIPSGSDPRVTALETRIAQTLSTIFRPDTYEHQALFSASNLQPYIAGSIYFGAGHQPAGPTAFEVQGAIRQRRDRAITLLRETTRVMAEDLQQSSMQIRSADASRSVMQICTNGHLITDQASQNPDRRKRFCPECGQRTIDSCPACTSVIQGRQWDPMSQQPDLIDVPNYCPECGAPYPWREAALENLRLVLEAELSEDDANVARQLLPDLLTETPKTQSAILRVKRIVMPLGKPVYDVVVKVISDVASETVKKALRLDAKD